MPEDGGPAARAPDGGWTAGETATELSYAWCGGATLAAERVGGRNGGEEVCGAVDGRRLRYSGACPPGLTRGEHRTCWTSRRSITSGYG